jgi:hypothetical protein
MLIYLIVLKLCPEQYFLKGEIIQKWCKTEICFFRTALLLSEIYLPTKYHVDIFYYLEVMSQTISKNKNKRRTITQNLGMAE